jgi:predicted Rossmann fold nucleotide-binding protein DprA/Smf involved in DNA uptake
MKKLQDQLKAVTRELTKLSKKVEKLQQQIAKASTASKKAPAKKKAVKAVKKKAAPKKKTASASAGAAKKATVLEAVYDVVRRSRNGATIAKLKDKTGLSPRQLSNALYKLSTRGMIEAKARGLYIKK